MNQKLFPDSFLVLVNNPKQPSHAENSFTNQIFWKRLSKSCKKEKFSFLSNRMSSVCHSYVIRMPLVCTRMSFVCTRISSVCHSYVLVCHPYVTRMYSYVIHMSLVCTRMSSVCHSYATRMYSYAIRMLLVCNRMSFLCYSSVVLPSTLLKLPCCVNLITTTY